MTIPAQFTIVTLGVRDLQRSVAFYTALGWEKRGDEAQGICWFKTSGCWVGLFGYDELSADMGLVPEGQAADPATQPPYRGITLAINVNSEEEVDAALAHATSVGGTLVKPATRMVWGGYSGYFTDPDGHVWEVARAPGFPVDQQGRIEIT
jgi:catechol 2,3-dioxygenase-like lactoylglutathione lyase family enzyme